MRKLRTSTLPARRRLTNDQAAEIQREYRKPGITTAYLGQKFGVSQQTAHRIATGQCYKELPTAPRPGERIKWQDPKVITRGTPSFDEFQALLRMCKANAGREALVKTTIRRPQMDRIEQARSYGLNVEIRRHADRWGIYVWWPEQAAA